jgi:F-type H+-transporting ATPase subunit epsilon
MPITLHLDIVTMEKQIFSDVVETLVASGEMGDLGIFPGHAPLLTRLVPGEIYVRRPGGVEELYYVSGGILEVQPYVVTVLADEVLRADDLDEAAAMKAKEHAKELINNRNTDIDYTLAAGELARAVAQIRAIQKLRKKH